MIFGKLKKEFIEFIGLIERKTSQLAELGQEAWDTHSPSITKAYDEYQTAAKEYATSTITTAKTSAQGVVDRVMYSSGSMNKLQDLVRFQGGYYRELCRERKRLDMLSLGGESLATLLAGAAIPDTIQAAYEAAV